MDRGPVLRIGGSLELTLVAAFGKVGLDETGLRKWYFGNCRPIWWINFVGRRWKNGNIFSSGHGLWHSPVVNVQRLAQLKE